MPLISLAQQWEIFARAVLGDIKPGTIQYNEMRKAFYCGYTTGFRVMENVSTHYTEDEAFAYLTKLDKELREFEEAIKKLAEQRQLAKN